MLFDTIQSFKDSGKEKEYSEALKELLYPISTKDKEGTEAWNTYSLAILKDFKGAGELFIKNIANLLTDGDEINNLVLKDLPFFEMLFSYNNFPDLLDSLQGKQEIIEVYEPHVPEEGTSFLSKTPFLDKKIIEERIGTLEGKGSKQTVYVSKVQLDFLFEKGVLADFCSVLDKVKDDKIFGNETLEIVIGEIWRKT